MAVVHLEGYLVLLELEGLVQVARLEEYLDLLELEGQLRDLVDHQHLALFGLQDWVGHQEENELLVVESVVVVVDFELERVDL